MSGTEPGRWRKKPVTVEAVRWTGVNLEEIYEFTGRDSFDKLDEQDRANCDDPEATATVFDKLHSTWILVYDGQWIIKGIKGEFCPCAEDVFRETYEPAASVTEPVPELAAAMAETRRVAEAVRPVLDCFKRASDGWRGRTSAVVLARAYAATGGVPGHLKYVEGR